MKKVFLFAPGTGASWPLLLIVAFAIFIVGYILWAPRHVRFEVSPGALRIRGDFFYGRSIAMTDLNMSEARILDLAKDREFALSARTNGTGLPGYKGGWFRLRNGAKALAFVGDPHRVVFIPVKQGYSLLLSAADPAGLLASLKND